MPLLTHICGKAQSLTSILIYSTSILFRISHMIVNNFLSSNVISEVSNYFLCLFADFSLYLLIISKLKTSKFYHELYYVRYSFF